MPNSLRSQIKKLAHEGKITEEESNELILKLDGHDKKIKADVIDEFVKAITESNKGHWRTTRYEHGESVCETMSYDIGAIKNIAEQLKEVEE